ncbi:hypothetical protein [Winogradskyella sp. PC D3.3]
MKYNFRNYILCVLITLNLSNCGKNTNTKSETVSKSKIEINKSIENSTEFVYSSADKIEIIIKNDFGFLVVGEPTEIYLKKENLYKRLSNLKVEKNKSVDLNGPEINSKGLKFELTATEENLLDGNIEILLTERTDDGGNFTHELLIPVKKQLE